MPKRKRIDRTFYTLRENRWREVRDLYNKLCREFKRDRVLLFLERQYFMNKNYVNYLLAKVDTRPVENGSIVYLAAMQPGFDIRPHLNDVKDRS